MGFYFATYLDTHYHADLVVPSVQFRSTDLSSDTVPTWDTGYVHGSTQNATTSYQIQITLPDPHQRSTGGPTYWSWELLRISTSRVPNLLPRGYSDFGYTDTDTVELVNVNCSKVLRS